VDGSGVHAENKESGTMPHGTSKSFNLAAGVGLIFVALGLLAFGNSPPSALRAGTLANAPPSIVTPGLLMADNDNTRVTRPFDFSDAFYLQNGINPANILNRVNGTCPANDMPSCSVVDNSNTDPDRRNIRVLSTTGGFDHEGNPLYYDINGMVSPSTFTNDAAGQTAMATANFFSAYIFPKASGDPLSPALSNRRQDNVFETRNGYFVANPLGLWTAVFVSYTREAFTTAVCQTALADLRAKNGADLDGTPMIRKAIEVDDLGKKGCAIQRTRNLNGSQGFPWII